MLSGPTHSWDLGLLLVTKITLYFIEFCINMITCHAPYIWLLSLRIIIGDSCKRLQAGTNCLPFWIPSGIPTVCSCHNSLFRLFPAWAIVTKVAKATRYGFGHGYMLSFLLVWYGWRDAGWMLICKILPIGFRSGCGISHPHRLSHRCCGCWHVANLIESFNFRHSKGLLEQSITTALICTSPNY